jgi:hypothetical protein
MISCFFIYIYAISVILSAAKNLQNCHSERSEEPASPGISRKAKSFAAKAPHVDRISRFFSVPAEAHLPGNVPAETGA